METRPSSWLGAFRRKLRQDEAAAEPLSRAAESRTAQEAGPTPHAAPAAWHPAHPAPNLQSMQAWQAAAPAAVPPQAPAYAHAVPAYAQPVQANPQPLPAFPQPTQAYPAAVGPYPQQMALYPQAAPVAFAAPAPPVAAAVYHPLQPAYPYPVHAPVPQQAVPALHAYAPPPQPVPAAPPAPVVASRWDDASVPGERDSRDGRPAARTVEELRHDLREFREAVLDLAESRARRRYA